MKVLIKITRSSGQPIVSTPSGELEGGSTTLSFNDYQQLANRTSRFKSVIYSPIEFFPMGEKRLLIGGLGLAGEAGEVADMLKKGIGHSHPFNRDKLRDELGDVLWYVAELASAVGFTLQEIAERNVTKLAARYPEGKFSTERSINRKES